MNKDFEKVDAKIIGADGNIFNLLGICSRALKENGYKKEAEELCQRVTNSSSYDMALSIIQEYVNPVSVYENDLESEEIDYGFN